MASRYCSLSGSFTSASIWRATSTGATGASVPTVNDDVYYTASPNVIDCSGPIGNTTVSGNPVNLTFLTANPMRLDTGKKLRVSGVLNAKNTDILTSPGATVEITSSSVATINLDSNRHLKIEPSSGAANSSCAVLNNAGTINVTGTGAVWIFAAYDQAEPHCVGNVPLRVNVSSYAPAGLSVATALFCGHLTTGHLTISPHADTDAPSLICDFGDTNLIVGTLTFAWQHTDAGRFVQWIQNGSLTLSGDIQQSGPSTPTTVDWQLGANASLAFVGGADQVIDLPPDVVGQTWIVTKSNSLNEKAGTLDLVNFIGGLKGHNQEFGYAEQLIVRGPSVVTAESDLKFDELHVFGRLIIPGGVTVQAEQVTAEVGASIEGAGTLAFPQGGLTVKDFGIIQCNVSGSVKLYGNSLLKVFVQT